ncbi:SdpI family protein [Acetobacter sp. P1H12_c]|uniref:SdpI family protein n=1 Tax=Acetobacter sp. P1H12_c TaxID=2762621 RepID=UPI001C058F0E|nr:SdpI family protein [Acetobacter sp. P1H12_c]
MQHRYGPGITLALSAATLAIGLVLLWRAPDGALVPVHFSGQWVPDRFATPAHALTVWLGLLAALWLFFRSLAYGLRNHSGFQASMRVYDQAWITLTALLCALAVGCMEAALGIKIALGSLSSVMLGVFFIVVGNGLGKIRPNSVLGLRTPWTKASVRVWERTHRACAPFFILTGVFLTATGFGVLGAPLNRTIMNLCLLGLVALCYGLSWIYWRQEQKYG